MDAYWFDTSGYYQSKKQAKPSKIGEDAKKQKICCAACGNIITCQTDAIEISGAHQHLKTNPQGRQFKIRCFSTATGCACYGDATDYYTWFSGYSWRFAHCSKCTIQLGWHFKGDGSFFGLIGEQLKHCND